MVFEGSDSELVAQLEEAYAENARLRARVDDGEARLRDAWELGREVLGRATRAELEARALVAVAMRDVTEREAA